MGNYEVVYDTICRLGGARLEKIVAECKKTFKMSRRTISNSIRLLEMDYMVSVKNKVWHSTSAGPRALGKAAKSGQLGNDRSALCRGTEKTRGSGVVAQNADLPEVMKHIVDELVSARTKHNKLEGVRTMRAKISRKKRRMNLLDTEVTHDLSVLARLLWVAMKTSTWETDPNFRAWLTADMNRLVPGWRDKVNQAVVELGEAA